MSTNRGEMETTIRDSAKAISDATTAIHGLSAQRDEALVENRNSTVDRLDAEIAKTRLTVSREQDRIAALTARMATLEDPDQVAQRIAGMAGRRR